MYLTHDVPLGTLTLAASDLGLTRCAFTRTDPGGGVDGVDGGAAGVDGHSPAARRWLDLTRGELDAYFDGELREFTVPVDLSALPEFDRHVLDVLARIDYGQTTTYRDLAVMAGWGPRDARLIGGVMSRNPLLIVVPCHRVLGSDGSLVGYSGGLPAKRRLLDLESACRLVTDGAESLG